MRTKASAEATLREITTLKAEVIVADAVDAKTLRDRRTYSFVNENGNEVKIATDAEPSLEQLADLARHLPLEEKDRDAALEEMTRTRDPEPDGDTTRTR